MKVAFGLKAHSGWAALVVLGEDFAVVDRRRIELAEETWAKQPYHAAEGLERQAARELVTRGVDAAHRIALSEMKAAVKRERDRKNEVVACAVLVGTPMPDWSTDEILAVHFRMHKAEGVIFQKALVRAAEKCKLKRLCPKSRLRTVQCGLAAGCEAWLCRAFKLPGKLWGYAHGSAFGP